MRIRPAEPPLFLLIGFVAVMTSSVLATNRSAHGNNLEITEPQQRLDVPFRIFLTENIWNQLLLDTTTGQVWQLAFTIEKDGVRAKIPVNITPLVSVKEMSIGRFTLYPTGNMWNFLLLDQIDGRSWQCQFSTGEYRGCWAIRPPQAE